eukprot:CAMPEP_0117041652 /NCGR_PEP_ID=MMETSP0472-20121206/29067_1 /TAXON_ID=693140 ORGANISM="Tiarina fusus, Strain LIS" /NCGR_SAMPLE_ID=MMETSP0472 /ASSEMBLY_ACC=CAM_ASM_000603 /LENGTH=158 /DNA_ID=CAMNT_0004752705 /DNA_START=8 /DNA_END=484 /DNA_ORIENTATION=+
MAAGDYMKPENFTELLRVLNTNVDGKRAVPYALTAITGIGRRFAFMICKKAGVDVRKKAGELNKEEVESLTAVLDNPRTFDIPDWFLNRQRDFTTGKTTQLAANGLSTAMREDLERMKKMRLHRGLRHFWGLKANGQKTKTSGRGGHYISMPGLAKRR